MITDGPTLNALRLAGEQIVRDVYETTDEVPDHMARPINRQESLDLLDEVGAWI